MKLVIAHDNGDCEVVVDGIEDYNFHALMEQWAILNAIERTINKVKAFQAATPPDADG